MKNMTAKEFLIGKGILDMGLSKWIVTFSNGRILDIVELMEEYRNQSRWISVKDRPLFTIDEKGNWECTSDGDGEFIAAVPYYISGNRKNKLWWIRHCTFVDADGLHVVTDDETEKAGWDMKDVVYYHPLPEIPTE